MTDEDIARPGLVIGPTEGGADVSTVVVRPPANHAGTAPRAGRRRRGARGPGYAHVNIWRLNETGAAWDDSAARAIAAELARHPGFRSYALVKSGEWEVVAVTVFDTEAEARAAMAAVAPLVRERVSPLVAGGPTRREGPLLHYVAA